MVKKIGFIVNPIAGMGGKVGLKGTDGVVDEAKKRGAQPVAPLRATEMLQAFVEMYNTEAKLVWHTCSGSMGEKELHEAEITDVNVVYNVSANESSSDDTHEACRTFKDLAVDIVVFCGGDGTARDIFSIIGDAIPLLGIPAGVKMHSGVFGINPDAAAKMLNEFIQGQLQLGDAEIMDLDEDRYRRGEWNIKLFGVAKGIVEPTYVQVGKMSYEAVDDTEVKDELAEHVADEMKEHPDYLYFFGSGGTLNYIAEKLELKNTLLGIDAIYKNQVVGVDLNEKQILQLLDKYQKAKVLLSPIGAQGFILGRGNLQLSNKVIKKLDKDNILIVSTPSKLASTPFLRVDTGDKNLDQCFKKREFMMVAIGYRLSRVVKIKI